MSAHDDGRSQSSPTSPRREDPAALPHDSVTPGTGSPSPPVHSQDRTPSTPPTSSSQQDPPAPPATTPRQPRPAEVTMQIPPTRAGAPPNLPGTPRSPRNVASPNVHDPSRSPTSPRYAPAFSDGRADWPTAGIPPATSGQPPGDHRALDALFQVGARSDKRTPPRRGWRRLLYQLTGVNLGMSPDELRERELNARIRRNIDGPYQIGVFGLKGGVGKTAVTVTLGSALSKIRGDRILAVDADPDCGNLTERVGRQSSATVADLLSHKDVARYNDIRAYTSINDANLEVLSSEEYSGARREFNDDDWKGTVGVVSRYYNLVIADCGSGMFQPASRGVLSTVSGLVIVASASIDGARQAAVTMDWLRQNGYQDLLRRSCVVINHVVPGHPNTDVEDLVQQFERHVMPGRVVVLPWDKHIAAGTEIQLDMLGALFRRRITELAAALSDDFDRPSRR